MIARRPVVVAAHGNSDGPQWMCPLWRGTAGGDVFVLCPRGIVRADNKAKAPGETRYTYANAAALEAEVNAGLEALRQRFGAYIAEGPIIYAGFSLGASLGVPVVLRDPRRYSRLVLTEGGEWTPAAARSFAQGGGQRVLFACGQASCVSAANRHAALLEKVGVATRVVHAVGAGAINHGEVADRTRENLPWLVEGDERWKD